MMKTMVLAGCAGIAVVALQCVAANPIDPEWYADPQIRLYGKTFWVYPTYSHDLREQTFLDCFSSKDLKSWTKHEKILTTNAVLWAKGAMWAPDAHEKDGRYYFFFGANDVHEGEVGGIGVAVADNPAGPFSAQDQGLEYHVGVQTQYLRRMDARQIRFVIFIDCS